MLTQLLNRAILIPFLLQAAWSSFIQTRRLWSYFRVLLTVQCGGGRSEIPTRLFALGSSRFWRGTIRWFVDLHSLPAIRLQL